MVKLLAKKQGLKRSKSLDKAEDVKKKLRKKDTDKKIISSSPSSAEEDYSSGEIFAFDSFLKQFGLKTDNVDGTHTKRPGKGETISDSKKEKLYANASGSDNRGSTLKKCKPSHIMMESEEDETDDEASSRDAASGFESDSLTNVEGTSNIRSFDHHFGRILTNKDADELVKSQWKYNWKMPAIGMPSSNWVGTGEVLSVEVTSELVHRIKPKLYEHWLDFFKASKSASWNSRLNFFSLCNSYRDIMHCNKIPFYLEGKKDSCKKPSYLKGVRDLSIMDAYLMHAINHVFKTRDLVSKNNAKVTMEGHAKEDDILSGSSFLDHGFTRPKVLFLLPLGSIALRVVKRLIKLTPSSNRTNVEHFDRFCKEFGANDIVEDDGSSKTRKSAKPEDFECLFGGNNNDHFVVGMKLTKRSIKLYSDFYSSDIIVASPLGLVTKIGEAEADKEKDVDYLSSIEVLIIDHADVIAMQNWSHLSTVVEHLNHTPSRQHGADVMRIRQWYLDGNARFYRQTIVLGSFLNPDMNSLFNRSCVNYEGKVKLTSKYEGVITEVLHQIRQVYVRFDASSIADVDDARLEFFSKRVFPRMNESEEGGIMIFISSYFEYVRIRNFLTAQNASFCVFGDYAEPGDISRARVWFFEGRRKIMLYTERAHFYHRYKIRGVKKLFIYSLPERKELYPEIVNMIEEAENVVCKVFFSRFDHLRVERIVGTFFAKKMVSSHTKMWALGSA